MELNFSASAHHGCVWIISPVSSEIAVYLCVSVHMRVYTEIYLYLYIYGVLLHLREDGVFF